MDRNYRELIVRVVIGALLIASLGALAACGGGSSSTPLPPASGSAVWSLASNPTSSLDDEPYAMVINGNSLYVVGYDRNINTPVAGDQWRIENRNTSSGSLVASFGTPTGVVVSNPTGTAPYAYNDAYAIATDPTSTAMYVVGFDSETPSNTFWEWRIEKRDLVTGASITAFNGSGAIQEHVSAYDDAAFAVAVDSRPTGTLLYVVGYEGTVTQGTEWRIEARDKETGALVSWVSSTGLSNQDDSANAIAIDPNEGYMYVVGSDYFSGDEGWRIEKRTLSAPLSLETTTFGTGGFIYSQPSTTGGGGPFAVALDDTSIYIAGDEAYTTGSGPLLRRWRIEKRNRFTGALDTAFGQGAGLGMGFVNSNTSTSAGVNAMAIDANYMYIAGFDNTLSGYLEWRIEKRSLATGALVSSFGSGGVVLNNFGSQTLDHSARAIAVDASYIYVAGYESVSIDDQRWRIMKLYK